MEAADIKNAVRDYIKDALFNGESPKDFNDDTLLVSTRLLDSIITLNMVVHFEELLNIEFEAHEVNIDNLDSVNIISDFLAKKANLQ